MAETILDRIVQTKREEVAAAKARVAPEQLQSRIAEAPPVRDFLAALRNAQGMGLIAEVKKASPSAGVIREDFDPVEIASTYARAGAHCLSCLTDEPYFQGRLEFLSAIREQVATPVMRKDFLLDEYQIDEARVAGADCVLLIAECLDDAQMRRLFDRASELGMAALIELYEPANLERVLRLDPPLVGINNRNLRTFETSLSQTIDLASQIPDDCLLVSESGIRTRDDVERLAMAGVRALLIGETLMRADNIADKIAELL